MISSDLYNILPLKHFIIIKLIILPLNYFATIK